MHLVTLEENVLLVSSAARSWECGSGHGWRTLWCVPLWPHEEVCVLGRGAGWSEALYLVLQGGYRQQIYSLFRGVQWKTRGMSVLFLYAFLYKTKACMQDMLLWIPLTVEMALYARWPVLILSQRRLIFKWYQHSGSAACNTTLCLKIRLYVLERAHSTSTKGLISVLQSKFR